MAVIISGGHAPDCDVSVSATLTVLSSFRSRPKEAGPSGEESNHICFFSFSLIEGYISLVMDEQTTRRLSNIIRSAAATTSVDPCRVNRLWREAAGGRGGDWFVAK